MKCWVAVFCVLVSGVALAQSPAGAACAVPDHLPPARLSGVWTLSLWPQDGPVAEPAQPASRGAVLFERHPEFTAGVRGQLKRSSAGNDLQALLSGDVTDGEFHLDESADGRTMSAVWSGTAQDCGGRLVITGTRRPAEGQTSGEGAMRFRLDKAPGWR